MNTSSPLLLQAAHLATAHQNFEPGSLYVVATPIGNLADITLRAMHVLARVDAWACEDTRVSAQLLRHLGLEKPLLALHEHNEHSAAQQVIDRLAAGQALAYVSDAGTPAVSDPGALLVARVQQSGHRVVPIPGASSVLAALCVAGDSVSATQGQGFVFVGFLPSKGAGRREALQRLLARDDTQVLFEAPHRIEELAAELAAGAPQRRITLCRELTKQFETIHSSTCVELPAWLAHSDQRVRGEFVLVLHARPAAPVVVDALSPLAEQTLRVLLRDLPLKQAVALAAEICGAPRNTLYQRALDWREG